MGFRRCLLAASAVLALAGVTVPAVAQEDLIFKKSTVWKMLTPDDKLAVYGVDDPVVDADNGRGWAVQQVTVFGRFLKAVTPRFLRAPFQPGLRPPAE